MPPIQDGTCNDTEMDEGTIYESLFDRIVGSVALLLFFALLALLLMVEPMLWEMTK